MKRKLDESGQTLVEYILAVAIALSVVVLLTNTVKGNLFNIWQRISQEVSAACPGCPVDPRLKIR
ncbi:hypothetical protein K2X30_08775 [bacterium]|jgi:Flp pilus assembly pilin Flp|nr:hypothetical protein [bacterium]